MHSKQLSRLGLHEICQVEEPIDRVMSCLRFLLKLFLSFHHGWHSKLMKLNNDGVDAYMEESDSFGYRYPMWHGIKGDALRAAITSLDKLKQDATKAESARQFFIDTQLPLKPRKKRYLKELRRVGCSPRLGPRAYQQQAASALRALLQPEQEQPTRSQSRFKLQFRRPRRRIPQTHPRETNAQRERPRRAHG
ncbi:hypothetical protein BDP27DRAFT_420632 [Rhodocollybia butyracea]|uniref:Uncharacterized protein n=1 Tax=Rhodocollybia butyracea TaxID=206335 RepID=A0A9P5PD18_9AGAR|nr:hypothetical protein BDP27DRAFT_420632 [Rhodocollybia butyracea]